MSIPYLKGWWDEIAQPMEKLAHAIPRIINPNLDTQLYVKKKLIDDPTYLQQLADAEAETPGLVKRLGLGTLQKEIDTLGQSNESKMRNIVKTKLGNLSSTDIDELIARKLGTKTEKERKAEDIRITSGELGIEGQKADLAAAPIRLSILGMEYENLKKRAPFIDTLIAADVGRAEEFINNKELQSNYDKIALEVTKTNPKANLFELFNSGRLNQEQATSLIVSKHTSKLFEEQRDEAIRQRAARLQRELASNRGLSMEQLLERTYASMIDDVMYANPMINPQVAVAYFQLPQEQKEALSTRTTVPEDPNERQFWQVSQALKTAASIKRRDPQLLASADKNFISKFQLASSQLEKGEITKEEAVSRLNQISALEYSALLGGEEHAPVIGIKKIPRRGFDKEGLVIIKNPRTGLSIDIKDMSSVSQPEPSGLLDRVVSMINSGSKTYEDGLATVRELMQSGELPPGSDQEYMRKARRK